MIDFDWLHVRLRPGSTNTQDGVRYRADSYMQSLFYDENGMS